MLRHQLGQDLVLGLHLLLQELNPFLFLLRLTARMFRRLEGGRSVLEDSFCLSGRTPSAAGPVLHTDRKPGPCLKDGVVGWPPSPQLCSACALFSYVRSAILTDERFVHFQLRRDIPGSDA